MQNKVWFFYEKDKAVAVMKIEKYNFVTTLKIGVEQEVKSISNVDFFIYEINFSKLLLDLFSPYLDLQVYNVDKNLRIIYD